jgi:hypothetical protein
MVGQIIGLMIVWRALTFPVIVNNQVARQPH